jgi:hypothetical protein
MDGRLGFSTMDFLVPEDFSGIQIETENFPKMNRFGNIGAVSSEIESLFRALGITQVDDGGKEDPLAPNDRAGPTPTGDIGFPGDIFGAGPGVGKAGVFGNPA